MDAILGSLTEAELALVREADSARLAAMDEDTLIDLHNRVRRARNKQVKNYRRRAATRVPETGGRGKAYARNARRRAKAEVFEELLATVSGRLAAVARDSAETLRAERLADPPPNPAKKTAAEKQSAKKTPAEKQPAKKTQAEKQPAKKTRAEKQPAKKTPAGKQSAKKPAKKLKPQRADRRPDTPDRRKRHASTRAAGARRQARRDSR